MPSGAVTSAAAAAAVSATVHQDAPMGAAPCEPERTRRDRRQEAPAPSDGAAAAAEPRRRVHWYWRLLAWIVAVPLGFVVTAWPAYHFKWIKKDDLLDVFVGSGNGRYSRLAVLTLAWALVTALLVQLFVEGGRWFARRRQARKTTTRGGGSGGSGGDGRGGERRGPVAPTQPPATPPAKRPVASAPR
ncbi:MAG: hypothetical protein U0W40_15145 [Acidimicrobiia bacterium]